MFEIKNNKLQVEIANHAAEVHNLKKIGEDYNYVWCGDPNYWSGRNPILFPQVDSTSEKTIKINGIKKPIGNHGFARNAEFELVEEKEDELTLKTNETEETYDCYPYKFELTVNYKLNDNRLDITYTITNNDDKIMPFGFGLHPAFACAHNYEDTSVSFNNQEVCGDKLIINQELFDKYPTYVINKPNSTVATLNSKDRSISIEYIGYNIFAIWSKGDYVCLEPWMNTIGKDPEIEFKDNKGMMFIEPKQNKVFKYSWIVNK